MWEHGPGPVAGSGPEIGGADVGLRCAGYAAPSVWSTWGTLRPYSRGLIPGPVRLGDHGCFMWLRIQCGTRPVDCIQVQVAYG
jgi:hypothetical protein